MLMIFRRFVCFASVPLLVAAARSGQTVGQSAISTQAVNDSASISSAAATASNVDTRQDVYMLPPDLTGAVESMISSRKDLQNGGSVSPTPIRGTFGRLGSVYLSTPLVNRAAESSLAKRTLGVKPPTLSEAMPPRTSSLQGPSVSAEASSASAPIAAGGGAKTSRSGLQKNWGDISPRWTGFDSKVSVGKPGSRLIHKKAAPPKKAARKPV